MSVTTDAERADVIKASPLAGKYDHVVDRESAYEVLMGRAGSGQVQHEETSTPPPRRRAGANHRAARRRADLEAGAPPPIEAAARPAAAAHAAQAQSLVLPIPKTAGRHSDSIETTIIKSAARTATNVAVREASKAIFGSGRNAGILGGLLRGVLGGLQK